MRLISVREHGKLKVGELDPTAPSVTAAQAEQLANLKPAYGYEVFKYVNGNTLSAQQYVGVFQMGRHTVEVLPKIEADESKVRRNLVSMLAVALELNISEGDIACVATQSQGILEVLIRLFCDKLFLQVHRGMVRRYEAREDNLPVLRGRLGVVEQVRLNAANPERLYCRFDEFHEDNPLNQVLKAAIRLLLRVTHDLKNQRQLSELIMVFEGVSDVARQSLPWTKVVFDRLSERYRPCFKLAELFLSGMPPDVTGGESHGFSLFFDMNMLFEEYIGRTARRIFGPMGYRLTLQGPQKHLAFDIGLCRSAFTLRPDVVCRDQSEVVWILDTKWKQLSSEEAKDGVSQADMYQMYAYANCYGCPQVVLLYPHHSKLGLTSGTRATYRLNPFIAEVGNRARQVSVATIRMEQLATVPSQLKQILGIAGLSALESSA